MRAAVVVLMIAVVLGACGDNARPCDYVERNDDSNADSAEITNLAVGVHTENLCGAIDTGHGRDSLGTLDVDTFRVTVEGSGELLVQVTAGDGAAILHDVSVRIFDTATNPTLLAAGAYDPTLAGHGAFIAQVTPGTYDVVVSATAAGDISASIDYRVRISADPSARCGALGAPDDYTEAHDGDDATGNDTIAIDYTQDPQFVMSTGTPEPTGLSIIAGDRYRLTGASAATAHSDEYLDRDTFELATDDTTNELTIRLDWDDPTVDLDYVLFAKASLVPSATSNLASTRGPELQKLAVKPATKYWLWVGRFKGASGPPAPYRVTVCGDHFFE